MCGIAGLYQFDRAAVESALLGRMNAAMIHRGPDAEGFYTNGPVGLCMRRLKVIDLATGDQPLHDGNQKVWIVFNGEIYNYRELREALEKKGHRFYTHSDTEVLLHQYLEEGEDCVHALKGMFGFAIYDSRTDSLFVARDRLGVKPLFYFHSARGFAFGSEIKPLLEIPWIGRKINLQAISHFLSLNYLPAPWTPFEGILQLLPGHSLTLRDQKISIRQYWDVPLDTREESEEAALRRIEELLHQSMRRRLIADVPIGAFLSGGLDSSALIYLMKEERQGAIKTFSVGFDDPSYNETPYAQEVARYFGTQHYEIECQPDDVRRDLLKTVWHADNLLADQAALPLYEVARLAKKHVTVCLSGDGGDELFVGYPTFHADRYHRLFSRFPKFLRKHIFENAAQALPASSEKLSFEYKAKKFVEAGDFDAPKAHYWWRTIFTDREKQGLFNSHALGGLVLDAFPLYGDYFRKAAHQDFLSACLYADIKVWLAGNNLYKVDSMTMAHGLEARVPFLDHELVEYMAHLPIHLKFKGNTLKYLLKKGLRGKLPETVLKRKKAGWHSPIAGWFKGPLREYVQTTIGRPHPVWDSYFNRAVISNLMKEHFQGRHNHSFKIWGLLVLHHWADHFFGARN